MKILMMMRIWFSFQVAMVKHLVMIWRYVDPVMIIFVFWVCFIDLDQSRICFVVHFGLNVTLLLYASSWHNLNRALIIRIVFPNRSLLILDRFETCLSCLSKWSDNHGFRFCDGEKSINVSKVVKRLNLEASILV